MSNPKMIQSTFCHLAKYLIESFANVTKVIGTENKAHKTIFHPKLKNEERKENKLW